MRLIDAEVLAKFIDFGHLRNPNEKAYSENDIREMIDMCVTIDAPVRHGRWIESTTDLICSSCETVFNDELAYMCRDYTYGNPRYCPYCGAKMDEEE